MFLNNKLYVTSRARNIFGSKFFVFFIIACWTKIITTRAIPTNIKSKLTSETFNNINFNNLDIKACEDNSLDIKEREDNNLDIKNKDLENKKLKADNSIKKGITKKKDHSIYNQQSEQLEYNEYYEILASYSLERAMWETLWDDDNDGDPEIERARLRQVLLDDAKITLEKQLKTLTAKQRELIKQINDGEINPDNFKLSKLDPATLRAMLNDPEGISYTFARILNRLLLNERKNTPYEQSAPDGEFCNIAEIFSGILDKILGWKKTKRTPPSTCSDQTLPLTQEANSNKTAKAAEEQTLAERTPTDETPIDKKNKSSDINLIKEVNQKPESL